MSAVKRLLILSFSTIARDPRVMRQIQLLAPQYQVAVAGFGSQPDATVDFIELQLPKAKLQHKLLWAGQLLARQFEWHYWGKPYVREGLQLLAGKQFDAILANDISALPLALKLAKGKPVLIDAHEYTPKEFEDSWRWRLFFGRYSHYLCQRYLPQTAAMTTVCQGIADEYTREYGVRPSVIHNAPPYQDLSPSPTEEGRIRLIHHGAAIRSRHIETIIKMMQHLDGRFTLDFMLVPTDPIYLKELREKAKDDERIQFIDPVSMPSICAKINGFDIGVYILPPINFNHEHALPNKFFEFIQARLAVAIGPSPEMAALVKKHACGLVASSFEPIALAQMLNTLKPEDIRLYKNAAHAAAAHLNFDADSRTLSQEIAKII